MKKECIYTRKLLERYLHGYLFRLQKVRVERHLKACAVCRSQFEALEHAEETRQYLRDLVPPDGAAHRMRDAVASLAKLKKVFYRPLWMAAIVLIAAGVYRYAIAPQQVDVELESIVKTAPATTAPAVPAPPAPVVSAPAVTTSAAPAKPKPSASPAAAPAIEPLAVTITLAPDNEKTAVRRINEIMRGHEQLRKKRFSDDVREITGSLTAKELLTFFNRIEPAGKAGYSRKRFESFPSAQLIPFVLKLKTLPKTIDKPAPPAKSVAKPAEPETPPVPAAPATAPAPSVAQ